jgi:RNA polymerase sigma factor (sigma-70 family)
MLTNFETISKRVNKMLDYERMKASGEFDAINRLPNRERLVVTLYYYEGMTLAEIGDVLGVTESRICQIHTKSVMSLRNRMIEPGQKV